MIVLPARPSDSLQWEIASADQPILWRFDLGLEDPYFPLEEEMRFQALSLALAKFTREIWPRFQEKTAGAVLYRGTADFSACFSWTERQKENWGLWLEERPSGKERHLKRLFCADAFAHYFQMLAHRLPDEMPLYLLLDGDGVGTMAERHQILSRERFDHFLLAAKGLASSSGWIWEGGRVEAERERAREALCFPEESACSGEVLEKIDGWMERFEEPFRVIPEAFLTEEWEGIDALHVLPEALSPQGERKLTGFRAAGGLVVDCQTGAAI